MTIPPYEMPAPIVRDFGDDVIEMPWLTVGPDGVPVAVREDCADAQVVAWSIRGQCLGWPMR